MKTKISAFLLATILLSATAVFGQTEKNEIEDSIDRTEMPEKALETLNEFWPDHDDIRYFSETDGETQTYEAKLEWQRREFSIEFDPSGNIIDVEQLLELDEIRNEASENIKEYLQEQFKRFRITRLQRQYLADDDDGVDDIDFVDDILEGDEEDYIIRYELEVEGNKDSEIGAFELLFNSSGSIIQVRSIVRRSLDNIW